MNFPHCGSEVSGAPDQCAICGEELPSKDAIRRRREVSLGIGIAVILCIGVAALLLVDSLLSGETSPPRTPGVMVTEKFPITGGVRLTLSATTAEVVWSDVTVVLSDGLETASWHPKTQYLTSLYPPVVWSSESGASLGALDVWMNVTDNAGNGRISNGDYITFTASNGSFLVNANYTFTLMHEPTGGPMMAYEFTG